MRMISFSLTTDQIRNRTKKVTRRTAWQTLTAGTLLRGVVKAMGLKKGEKVEELCIIRVTNVRREPLSAILDEPNGAADEGFPNLTNQQFIEMFNRHQGGTPETEITRIEFDYVEDHMTEANGATLESIEPQELEQQDSKPKSKGAARKKKPRTPEEQQADKEKKAELEAEAEAAKPKVDGKRAIVEGKQTRIAGTADPVPEEVTELANTYANTLHDWQRLQKVMTTKKAELMEAMKKHDIVQIETDDSYIDFIHEEKDKIKVKLKKDEDD